MSAETLRPGLIKAIAMAAPDVGMTGRCDLWERMTPSEVALMNRLWDRFAENRRVEDARQLVDGDTNVSVEFVQAQQDVMARLIRAFSRIHGESIDVEQFGQIRKHAVAVTADRGDLDAQYIDTLLTGTEKKAWIACAQCGERRSDAKVCGRCRAVHYCSQECQRTHWISAHKLACKPKIK